MIIRTIIMILLLCNVLLLTNANIYHECQILVKQTIDDVRLKFIESPNASPDTILSIEIDLKNCINVCPFMSDPLYILAVISFNYSKKNPSLAEKFILKAININREKYLFAYVWILNQQGKHEDALKILIEIEQNQDIYMENNINNYTLFTIPSYEDIWTEYCSKFYDKQKIEICNDKMNSILLEDSMELQQNAKKNITTKLSPFVLYNLAEYYDKATMRIDNEKIAFNLSDKANRMKLLQIIEKEKRNGNSKHALRKISNLEDEDGIVPPSILKEIFFYLSAVRVIYNNKHIFNYTNFNPVPGINQSNTPCLDKKMIFIIGMPRSGTSLLEKILCSHSKIKCLGESGLISEVAPTIAVTKKNNYTPSFVDKPHLAKLHDDFNVKLQDYIKATSLKEDGNICEDIKISYLTDKTPQNIRYIPFITAMFPKSTIIHIMRDPRDVFISIFLNDFRSNGMVWSLKSNYIEEYYKQYVETMSTWKRLGIHMLDISYEKLIEDPRRTLDKLFVHQNIQQNDNDDETIEFEESMLKFYLNKKFTHTVSSLQVKQGLTSKFIGRWKRYEKYIPEYILKYGDFYHKNNKSIFKI